MKISIITVVYNAEQYIEDCIESVIRQTHQDIEYIVIDGGSTDGTLQVVRKYNQYITHLVSEKDNGLYDAINKGIKLATGDVVGTLNADDVLVSKNIIAAVAAVFSRNSGLEAVYGDLNYVSANNTNEVIRSWKSRQADANDIADGWMPAHPTLYIKKELFAKYGYYALDFGTAADYDLILRYFYTNKLKAQYIPVLMVNMRLGGLSNRSISSLWKAMKFDYKALKRNRVPNALLVLLNKKLSKLNQF
ncbi:glycosyltransferase family 2 protein [Pedobacter agri]|uniref:glycosyltransferase family 2 protein n=1 Tax=Pedobacter agri TaxID=454586 RepID=UPI0010EEBF7D|nr:glycosyltransferase family 2 protein [Pedobacter agri]MDQ1141904.1 glycosyltransferase involved in cell wall biosynthesis [Pedobacter agri]RYF19533.1 MAG: glycosyltransferase [Flavobacteriales bacterium]